MLATVVQVRFLERPSLSSPGMVCAFRGWNDGGEAATLAHRYLAQTWGARPFAELDPEEFYDFQVNRPTVRLVEGVSRVIEWPKGEFAWARVAGRDVVLFTAPEPNVRWRAFVSVVLDTAREMGCSLLVTLGGFLADVPHSRPVPVVGSASDEGTVARLGLERSRYEGPTGIVGVLHDASNRSGLPSVSLWAAVPHYAAAGPNPKAALALVERASRVLGVPVDTAPLRGAARTWEERVTAAVAGSEELSEYVARLEAAAGEPPHPAPLTEDQVPSAEALAAEVERYLREQGDGGSP